VLDPSVVPQRRVEKGGELVRANGDASSVRILLAEDNAVNQRVALRLLRRLGYRADVASNGLEAVEALRRQPYDVVLMDVHMPEMDGFEATAEIRRMEGTTRHTAIVAITANAMAGDRDACLRAGMDDYVSKPIRTDELCAVLERWAAPGMQAASLRARAAGEVTVDGLNLRALGENLGPEVVEDAGLFYGLVDMYFDEAERKLEELRDAVLRGDARSLATAAHALSGSSRMLGLDRIGSLSQDLERMGRSASLEGAEEGLERLVDEFALRRGTLGKSRQARGG
jgi:CheY-like chemotaxis protein/HPt (histidine-containing phosphotransfer) domain-containing protein